VEMWVWFWVNKNINILIFFILDLILEESISKFWN
jgi:hypothetical protein